MNIVYMYNRFSVCHGTIYYYANAYDHVVKL
jgi:hypothetical protein